MKVITPKLHAILDYIVVLFLFISPSVIGLSITGRNFCYLLGGIHLLVSLCTNYSGGFFKVLPLRIHGLIEFFVSLGLIITAYTLFRNHTTDQVYFTALGTTILIVFILTDYKGIIAK